MSFDPTQFLDMQITEANDTVARPVPVGEYTAIITAYELRSWAAKDDPSKTGLALDLKWEIDSPELVAELGRKPTVKQGIMLDMSPDQTGLDMGKGRNVGLGRLREAVGKNRPGQPFSFSMLPGNAARIVVSHRVDKNNSENVYSEVKSVAAI